MMFKLTCAVQHYEWGKIGEASEVYKLLRNTVPDPTLLDSKLPYAELWIGTHPSGPSYISGIDDTSLAEYVSKFVECLGCAAKERFGRTLPFLFKVLSVNKALSIQAHPTKDHAKELHEQRPTVYKDANHKPEMTIALTPFEALVAFRPPVEIAAFVHGIRELLQVVGSERLADLIAVSTEPEDIAGLAIKAAYQKLMRSDEKEIATLVNELRNRLVNGEELPVIIPPGSDIDLTEITNLFVRLSTEFPGDVGCFSLFFLNHIRLKPGEAIFLEAKLPHAYLSGDCIECMACSDNVIRAGLTPKFKDVECLLSMLLYDPRPASDVKFMGDKRTIEYIQNESHLLGETVQDCDRRTEAKVAQHPEIISFKPPVEEFAVDMITIPSDCHAFELCSVSSASILLFIRGSGFVQRIRSTTNCRPTSSEQADAGTQVTNPLPAGRVHESIEFTRGSVIFIGAGIACFIQPYAVQSPVSADEPALYSCLVFRAYANVDS